MYNAHWIHSLPYSKFIELTLNRFHRQSVKEQDINKSCAAIIAAHDFIFCRTNATFLSVVTYLPEVPDTNVYRLQVCHTKQRHSLYGEPCHVKQSSWQAIRCR